MNTQIFEYNGNKITFNSGDSVMVNATEMAKPFKKLPADFLRLKSTSEFIEVLRDSMGIPIEVKSELVNTRVGGDSPGTWMHEDVAMEFARWLSPKFAIWCNARIKELLKHGFTASDRTIENIINDPDLLISLATELKREREEKRRLSLAVEMKESQILEQAHQLNIASTKVEYHDEVLLSESTYTSTTIAKELGTGAQTLHQKLHQMGIVYKIDGHWVLYHQYQGMGFTKTRTAAYTDREGRLQSSITTVWTEKGREFLHKKLNPYFTNPETSI